MKYEEIIGPYEYFQPVVDITEEKGDYWKQFIPTKDFLEVLRTFLNALEARDSNRKSIWIQGSYGTGKSHATSVIKHLLWDPPEDIEDFVEKIEPQIRERLRNFRKGKKVLPVTLKGISGIKDVKSFDLLLEKAVKEALQREKIEIITESEFEKHINYIKNVSPINYEQIIEGNIELKAKVKDKEGLLNALKRRDIEILKLLDNSLLGLSISHPAIEDWLVEVSRELSSKGIYALAIYWDEFTSLMELESISTIMSILQNIAEETLNYNVFLFIVSHRAPQQSSVSSKDYEKLLGRFHFKEYSMENITTFHIVSNAIRKIDNERWKNLQEEIFRKNPGIERLIWRIAGDDIHSKNTLKDLFPIHPYSAFIATTISRYVGSAERSIFSFLNDGEKGFKKFTSEYPKRNFDDEEYFLTPDMLWDFFLAEFERNPSEKIASVLVKHRQCEEAIKKVGESYLAVFKGILLLNILYSLINVSGEESNLYSPSEENIANMFISTTFQDSVPEILNYIDNEKGYVPKNPDGLFLVSYSVLPEKEVDEEKRTVSREYEDITKALSKDQKERLHRDLTSNVLRETEFQVYWAGIKDYELKRKLRNDFKNSYYFPIALFVAKNEDEIKEIKNIIEGILKGEDINADNIVLSISNTPLTEKAHERFIDYIAKLKVAEKHQYGEDAKNYRDYSEKLIEQWIDEVKNGYFEVYFNRQEPKRLPGKNLDSYLNEEVSSKIFWLGLENLKDLTNINVWKKRCSEKVLEIFISAQDRDDLEERTRNAPNKDLRAILMDNKGNYVVDKKLNFLPNIDINHPTYKICKDVEETIKKYEGKSFNLGDELRFLQWPPYGIYPNMANYAVLAFAMRPFIDKVYEEGTGRRIDKNLLKEKLGILFKYWGEGKNRDRLNLRLGTEEERKLTDLLVELFKLKEGENLNKARWGIREWVKKVGYPMWSLKSQVRDDKEMERSIDVIFSLSMTVDGEISEESIKESFHILSSKKNELATLLSPQKLKEGFKKWVEEKLEREITEEDFKNLMEFLCENMQEEVGLWPPDKVELKLKDWEVYISKEKTEREFVSLISKIFNLELERIDNLEDLKRGVKNKINNLGFPLWTLKYAFNTEDMSMRKALDDIDNFVKGIPVNYEALTEFLNDIRPYETHIHSKLTSETAKQGLAVFLKERYSLDLDLYSFIPYLRNKINKEEPYLWDETDLERVLREYNISKALGEIFDIDEILSIEELKVEIKRKIENLSYPFWLLELTEDGRSIFTNIGEFLRSPYTPPVEELESIVNDVSGEKAREFLRENKLKELAIRWLDTQLKERFDLKASLEDYILSGILEEMGRNICPEDFYWNRNAVENWIYKNEDLNYEIFKNIQEEVKQKIVSSTKDLKEVLLKIVEKYPEICVKLEEYLE
ncbi:MAG: hypothetical protein XD85_0045 [Parcubacteria bacterium 34_609]|nr:MAG: hypothetical protein XD85_0045 [Parcubacteria bacterium 34_609]